MALVMGRVMNATVTVNNLLVTRQGAYFHKALSVDNDPDPAYEQVVTVGVVTNAGTNDVVSCETGNVFVAETPESFTYDDDGNLLTDGRWTYAWNAENQLKEMESSADAVSAGAPRLKLAFVYDYMGRRVRKTAYSGYSGGSYQTSNTVLFVYDGWNLIEELRTSGGSTETNLYAWGLDLSGTLQGAGGIGGLLSRTRSGTNSWLYCYDANGNVGQILEADDGSLKAHYGPDPFGAPLVVIGEEAEANPFRFSTKYWDGETGLLYYGYRFYSPSLGRWLSRDPIGDEGFRVGPGDRSPVLEETRREMVPYSYSYVGSDPLNRTDLLGLVMGIHGDCCPYTPEQIAQALFDNQAGLISRIREPWKTAIEQHINNMNFTCEHNDTRFSTCLVVENGETKWKGGYTPRLGILRNVAYTVSRGSDRPIVIDEKENWKKDARLCVDQWVARDGLAYCPAVMVHETAHNVGWGNHYMENPFANHDNVGTWSEVEGYVGVVSEHQQGYWRIP